MKSLRAQLVEYISTRRALGTRLREPAQTLRRFVEFLARKRARHITIPLALEWAQRSPGVQAATWARELSMVRQFARWLSVSDPRHQVPPSRLLNVRQRRGRPHIYTQDEISRLMTEATRLRSRDGMKSRTLETLIGLLASTGLRPGEAAALRTDAVDLRAQVLFAWRRHHGDRALVGS